MPAQIFVPAPETLARHVPWNVWLLACRPKTFSIALVPIAVGTALSSAIHQTIRPMFSLLAFLSALLIQIGTNLMNDALDFRRGADTADRVGPKRVTQAGLIHEKRVLRAGFFSFLLSSVFAIPLVIAGGWSLLCVGLFSFLAGYAYTGGPFPLAYLGLGELFVLIFYGWVAVSGVYFLNSGTLDWPVLVAGAQVGLLAIIPIAINNLRDRTTDIQAGKKTLAVRLGSEFGKWEMSFLSFMPFLLGSLWFKLGLHWATVLPLLSLPLAFVLSQKVHSYEPGPIYNRFLGWGVVLGLSFGLLMSIGLVIK